MRHFFVVATLICGSVVALPAQSLREAAKRFGGAADNSYNAEFQLRSWDELVAKSDLIVRAQISGIRTLLVEKEALVATEYQFVPLQMIRQVETQRSATRPGSMPQLVVRRIGGRMAEGSYRYSTMSLDFPDSEALKVGDEVVLFLQFEADTGVYAFTDGPFGVFRVADGRAVPLTSQVATLRGDQPIELGAFVADLQRRAAKIR